MAELREALGPAGPGRKAGIDAPVRIVSHRGGVRTEDVVPKHAALTTHAGRRTFVSTPCGWAYPCP